MKQQMTLAILLAAGLAAAPLTIHADHHEKADATEEKGAEAEGSGGHSHNGAKAEGKTDVKKAGAAEEGSSAGHGHDAHAEEQDEGSH